MSQATHQCDRCGAAIQQSDLRYRVKLEVYAAADPLVVREQDLRRDLSLLREHLLEQAEAMSEEELMRDVYVRRDYDLCRRCQLAWLRDPLGRQTRSGSRSP